MEEWLIILGVIGLFFLLIRRGGLGCCAGTGTALIATIEILYFREPATAFKLVSIAFIIGGVVAPTLSGANH
jgi:hypothetical protein